MTPVLLSRECTNPSFLFFNARGDDGKIIKSKDDRGKMKAVFFTVIVGSMWGKSYLFRPEGWSQPMETEQEAIDAFFSETAI